MAIQGWTQDRVLALAPDAASAKAGQDLAHARKWPSLGHDDRVVWGECQGSGSKPYQVRFDTSDGGNKCSCPSRKFPCKHVIGLMLIAANSPVSQSTPPQWVAEWLESRAQRTEKAKAKAEAPPKPVDKVAQAKRREQRLTRIAEGLAATKVWAEDLLRTGLATVPSKGYEFFDEPARRMVDAQAPGVARRIRALGELAASGAHWQRPFLEQLASVHLLARAVERIDALPPTTRNDLLSTLGVSPTTDDATPATPVHDTWQVLVQERTIEDNLRAQRTWLFGRSTRQPALVLEFAHGTSHFPTPLAPGTQISADVTFFPGTPLRATLTNSANLEPIPTLDGFDSLTSLCSAVGDLLAQHPWLDDLALPLSRMIPGRIGETWSILDTHNQSLPATMPDAAGWLALAVSGGHPVDLVAAYDGRRLRPLAILTAGDYVPLTSPDPEAAP